MGLKLLAWGDSPTVDTGFGNVMRNLLGRFQETHGYDIDVLGVNAYGDPYDRKKIPYNVWPCDRGSQEAVFGFGKFWYIKEKLKPDIVFFLNDPWLIDQMFENQPKDNKPDHAKYIGYYPIDAGPLKPKWAKTLTEKLDHQVCYSHFAEDVIIEANGNKRPENLHQIYHGVNKNDFYPYNQSVARTRLGLPKDAFIVGMVARNQFRKRFDLLAKGFADFAKDKDDSVKLYLHTALKDIGFDIMDLARQVGIADRLILTEQLRPDKGVPIDQLNMIYNSFDVNCLISLGDGFGLPVAESMATGCAQLVSDNSCLKELVEGPQAGYTVKNAAWIMNTAGINTFGGVSDVEDMTKKLNLLYSSKELRVNLAQNGYSFISTDKFNWDVIAAEFSSIFKNSLHIL